MLSSLILRGALLASALSVTACTLQRASQMSRPATDEAVAKPAQVAAAKPDPQDEPTVGSEPVAGSDIVQAHAGVLVRAPIARVRAVIYDCPHYPDFLASYKACADIGPGAHGGRVWRMDIEEMGGMLKLWFNAEITKAPSVDPVEVYEGHMIEGSIKSFRSRWRLEPTERGFTRLTIESHFDPKLPLPASFINRGSIDGIKEAVLAIKRRAERDPGASTGTVLFEPRELRSANDG